ncbi:MAG: hypothetical protein M1818_008232 [Claussenomyces sp. TS43310]|nr:MAG: hypothetical protein M1818_008232 [Claussenomyces sp. TS43310]
MAPAEALAPAQYLWVYTFGLYIQLETTEEYFFDALSDAQVDQLIFNDPDAGSPILCFGVYPKRHAMAMDPPRQAPEPFIPIADEHFYRSYASLENVHSVQLFFEEKHFEEIDKLGRECSGILLTYSNGDREALGQCRISCLSSIEIEQPSAIHWKEPQAGVAGMCLWFSTQSSQFDPLTETGWQSREMVGVVKWWFNHRNAMLSFET